MLPQFADRRIFRPQPDLIALGLTLFLLGLCKKVILADMAAQWVQPVFNTAGAGAQPDLFNAWGAALGYALQIYFDFSGYSDMAIGIGMLFGIRLPRNFDSPYKARNIIEYWSRWHMTLTRFLTAYIYNPITLRWTRARMQAGKPVIKRGKTTPGAFLHLVATPTVLTMFLAGLWHGAGWQFIVFGALHGFYLAINHAWRTLKAHWGWTVDSNRPAPRIVGVLTTFVCVIVALVFFRAANVKTALDVLGGMAFLQGAVLPFDYAHIPGMWHIGTMLGFSFGPVEVPTDQILFLAGLLVIVWAFPNTQQWLRHFETSLGPQPKEPVLAQHSAILRRALAWRPTIVFGVVVGGIGFFALMRALSAAPSEFLYFKF